LFHQIFNLKLFAMAAKYRNIEENALLFRAGKGKVDTLKNFSIKTLATMFHLRYIPGCVNLLQG